MPAASAPAALTIPRRDGPNALMSLVMVSPDLRRRLCSLCSSFAETDAGAVDDRRPFGLFAVDDRGVLLGRGRFGLAAFEDDALAHFFHGERGAQLLVQPLDDRPRRAGGRQEAVAQCRVKTRQPGFGERRQLR